MKEYEIQEILYKSFTNEYQLFNTYIFRWESDYFGLSKAGFAYEVEIKTSRSDFLADAKKVNKHKELQLASEGNTTALIRGNLHYKCDELKKHFRREDSCEEIDHFTKEFEVKETERLKNIQLIDTSIFLTKIFAPNRFYYAVPDGLIKKTEVPKYAGLIYIKDNAIKKVKEAPLIHRKKYDFKAILLHKFHHMCIDQYYDIKRLKRENKDLKKFEGDLFNYSKNFSMF